MRRKYSIGEGYTTYFETRKRITVSHITLQASVEPVCSVLYLGEVGSRAEQCTPLDLVSRNEFNRAPALGSVVAQSEQDARGRISSVLWPVWRPGELVLVWVPTTDEGQPVGDCLFCECPFSGGLGVVGGCAVWTDRIPST